MTLAPGTLRSVRRRTGCRLLALFVTVVGARFCLLERFGSSLPFWDQWDGVGAMLLRPWFGGTFDWHVLFVPHNEHRIVLTRLWTLGLTTVNGQWDNLVETAANAVFCGGSAVLIGWALVAGLGRAFEGRALSAVAVCFVLPFGWENTLGGFQSQNYFLILFSLTAVWGLGTRRPGSAGWWVGLLGVVLACLSMASGFLAAVAVLGMRGWQAIRERRRLGPGELATGALCVGVVVAGWLTHTAVPAHRVLQAESPAAFVVALGRFLAWPMGRSPWLGWLMPVPLVALAAVETGSRKPLRTVGLLGAGGWALLQAAALAYGRGGQEATPASRYLDVLAVLPLAGFLAWQVLARRARGTRWRWPVAAGMALWLGGVGAGLWSATVRDLTEVLPAYHERLLRCEGNVRGYVATHDFARFLTGDPDRDLPHPSGPLVAVLVDDPVLRARLPAEVRPALAVEALPGGEAFVPGGSAPGAGLPDARRVWGSFTGTEPRSNQGTFRARIDAPGPLPYLRFSLAGDLGEPGLELSWESAAGGPSRRLEPGRVPHEHWRADTFPKPGPEILLTAADRSTAGWFAFSQPVEVGALSRWTGFLRWRGGTIFALGGLSFLGLLLPLRPRGITAAAGRTAAARTRLPSAARSGR